MPFDEEELDPYGECAAEIKRLQHQVRELQRTRSEAEAIARVAGYREGAAGVVGQLRAIGITVNIEPPLNEWRSINDDPPTDGSNILCATWREAGFMPGGPFAEPVVAQWDVESCGGEGGWLNSHTLDRLDPQPTHYRPIGPLPELPR